MREIITLEVNGKSHTLQLDPDTPLLYVLRNDLRLNGPKYGCALQQCGACMVMLDGRAQPSCMLPVSSASAFKITTLEGLGNAGTLHPIQEAFIEAQAAQCGYCLNGMVMSAVSLLNEHPSPDEALIRQNMQRNLCRCGSYSRIMQAIKSVATSNAEEK